VIPLSRPEQRAIARRRLVARRWRAIVAQARADVATGAGHECDEWRDTPDRRCALCDRPDDRAARLERMPMKILISYHERLVRDRRAARGGERTIRHCEETIPMIAAEVTR